MEDTRELIKELHKPVKRVKEFRKVRVNGFGDTFAIDLMIMPSPELNDGFKYVLVCEDCFTRYMWIEMLSSKDAKALWQAMVRIFVKADTIPDKLWGDQEGGWYSDFWKKVLKRANITLYSTYSDWGVSIVESAIRVLKTWMMPLMEEQGALRWVDLLPKVVDKWNHHKVSAMKMSPTEARHADPKQLYLTQYGVPQPMEHPPKYSIGDWVRVARAKQVFEKGYDARWSYQAFKIREVSIGHPVVYYLSEGDGVPVEGAFYENELEPTTVPFSVLIQDVVQTKGKKSLVHYRGFPSRFDEWLPTSELKKLGK